MLRSSLLLVALLGAGSLANAQTAGTITFTANKTSATGSLTPVLTWSTSPAASSCTASGAWSGTKAASGTQTLSSITSSKSYTLTCSWGSGSATIGWSKPTKNTDGTNLTNLASYKVVYGTSATSLTKSKTVSDPNATSTTVSSLSPGTWYFALRAVSTNATESANSNIASKTVKAATSARTVNITISAAASYKTNSTRVYDVLIRDGERVLGTQVGTVAIGAKCQTHYRVGSNYYMVARDLTRLTKTPRSNAVVARCAKS
jgi:hypothetical protein